MSLFVACDRAFQDESNCMNKSECQKIADTGFFNCTTKKINPDQTREKFFQDNNVTCYFLLLPYMKNTFSFFFYSCEEFIVFIFENVIV